MPILKETIEPQERVRRITVLISGSGSNLQAILDAALTDRLPNAQVTYVLSSRSNAYGLQRAAKQTPPVPTSVCALKTFLNRNPGSQRTDYDAEVARRVLESRPDVVVLAGWMHILSDNFLDILNGTTAPPAAPSLPPPTAEELKAAKGPQHHPSAAALRASAELPAPPPTQRFPIPCINLHPALPGAFDGAAAIPRAFEAFQKGEIKCTGAMIHRVIKEVDRGQPLVVREIEIKKEDTLEDLEERIHAVEHEIIVEGTRVVLEELTKEEATLLAAAPAEDKDEVADLTEKVSKLEA